MSAWNDLVTAALLGSAKAPASALPDDLQQALALPDDLSPEARFLTQAGAFALWRRAGWIPPLREVEIPQAEPETLPLIPPESAAHLRAMLGGRFAALLPEWLSAAERTKRRVPFELLPALLDWARKNAELRALALAVGGQRAAWLARQNSHWAFTAEDSPEVWETGTRDQRADFLRTLRAADPAAARAKLEATWKEDPAELRVTFLIAFETGLSEADVPFLEGALDDRSKEVRRVAADLLARLPRSPYIARIIARAEPLLVFTPGKLLARGKLAVSLPEDPDAAALRDGVDPKAFGPQKTLGGKAVALVVILAAVPLGHWVARFQQQPAAILKVLAKNEFAAAVATGFAWAALRQGDRGWAEALLDSGVPMHDDFLPDASLLSLLPEEDRARRLLPTLDAASLRKGDVGDWIALQRQLSTFRGYLPELLARPLIALIRRTAADGISYYLRGTIESLLLKLPPTLIAEALAGWTADQEGSAPLLELLHFRHDALHALS